MALVYANRVKETTTTTGTGTLTLAGAATGFQSFAAIGNANTCVYALEDANGTGWEVGVGTYTSSGTTLARTTILASSNSGSAITLSSGTHSVYVTADASWAQQTNLRIKAETVTTGNITGEVGTQHICTIAGLTANRDFVLPAVCAVGDRVSVAVIDGDDTYALLIKPAAGDTINGGTAGAEWSRLLLGGEVVTFRCVTANSAWIVENDGRIATYASIYRSAAYNLSSAAWTKIPLEAQISNNGMTVDIVTNNRITVRRSGIYSLYFDLAVSGLTDQIRSACAVYKNGSPLTVAPMIYVSKSDSVTIGTAAMGHDTVATVGNYYQGYGYQDSGSSQALNLASTVPTLRIIEVL
jgi:hypothetical protein